MNPAAVGWAVQATLISDAEMLVAVTPVGAARSVVVLVTAPELRVAAGVYRNHAIEVFRVVSPVLSV